MRERLAGELVRWIAARARTAALLAAASSALLACKTSSSAVRWTDEMEQWYPNSSVRPTEPPRALWSRADEELFQRRVGNADVVALGTLRLVTIYRMFDAPRQIGLAFRPQEVLFGSLGAWLDKEGELQVPLNPSDEDFRMAAKANARLAGTRYLIVLKRKPSSDDRVVLRWAMYVPDEVLMTELRAMFKWFNKEREGAR